MPILWQGSYGGSGDDALTRAIATEDGGYLLGGYSQSNPGGNKTAAQYDTRRPEFWVVKVNPSGSRQWDKSYWGGDQLNAIVRATGGGYLLGGDSKWLENLQGGGAKGATNWAGQSSTGDFWVICVSTNGARLWDQSYGGTKDDSLAAIAVMPDGGYLLGGTSDSAPSGNKTAPAYGYTDFWVVRTDAQGNKLWDRSYGGSGTDGLGALCGTADGGALLCGYSSSGVSGNKSAPSLGGGDAWVVRIDAQGNKLWDKTYGGSGGDGISTAVSTPDGGFLLVGGSDSSPSGTKPHLIAGAHGTRGW